MNNNNTVVTFSASRAIPVVVALVLIFSFQQLWAAERAYVGLELVPMTFDVSSSKRLPFSQTRTQEIDSGTGVITTTVETIEHQMTSGAVSYAPFTMRLRMGLTILPDLFPIISLESHLGFDVSQDTQSINYTEYVNTSVTVGSANPVVTNTSPAKEIDATVELDNYIGFYVKSEFPILDKGSAYILLGWASVQMSGPLGQYGLPADDTESSISYGFGGDYKLPWWDMRGFVEYSQLVSADSFTVSGIGLGVSIEIK